MPDRVLAALRCPLCAGDLRLDDAARAVQCPAGHSFDIARQGYVNLLTGHRPPGHADTAAMVAARADFLTAGHYAPISTAAEELLTTHRPGAGLVLDVGAGTGHYLNGVLDALPDTHGVAVDVSVPAIRRAARAHPRAAALVADVWRGLPLHSGSVAVVLDIFAPRNGAEFHRVLRPDGSLVVVTPTPRHLRSLVDRFGLLSVDTHKERRIEASLGEHFDPVDHTDVEFVLRLAAADVEQLVRMTPSAHHVDPDTLAAELAELVEPYEVTASVQVRLFSPTERDRRWPLR